MNPEIAMLIGAGIGIVATYIGNWQNNRAAEKRATEQAKRNFGLAELERDRATIAKFMQSLDEHGDRITGSTDHRQIFAEMRLMPGISVEGILDDIGSPESIDNEVLDHWSEVFSDYFAKRKSELFR